MISLACCPSQVPGLQKPLNILNYTQRRTKNIHETDVFQEQRIAWIQRIFIRDIAVGETLTRRASDQDINSKTTQFSNLWIRDVANIPGIDRGGEVVLRECLGGPGVELDSVDYPATSLFKAKAESTCTRKEIHNACRAVRSRGRFGTGRYFTLGFHAAALDAHESCWTSRISHPSPLESACGVPR